jgi:hypothetical protein
MHDPIALSRARIAEATRRMTAAGIPETAHYYRMQAFVTAVLQDEAEGRWAAFDTEGAPEPVATAPRPAPVAAVPSPAVAPVSRARSIWAGAVAAANREIAQGDDPTPVDVQDDATTGATQMPPAGSVARSRAAWAAAISAANAELLRRGGRIGEA